MGQRDTEGRVQMYIGRGEERGMNGCSNGLTRVHSDGDVGWIDR